MLVDRPEEAAATMAHEIIHAMAFTVGEDNGAVSGHELAVCLFLVIVAGGKGLLSNADRFPWIACTCRLPR